MAQHITQRVTLFLIAFLACVPVALHGQIVSAYATLTVPRISNVETGTTSGLNPQLIYSSVTRPGIGGGVTVTVIPLPIVPIGLDLRASTKPGSNGADTVLFGPKLTVKPPVIKFKPYVQAMAGYLRVRTPNASAASGSATAGTPVFTNNYFVYEILGGVDYPLLRILDFRIAEIGAGHSFHDGSAQGVGLFTFATGLVAHF